MPGIIDLDVQSDAGLALTLQLAMQWHNKAVAYRTESQKVTFGWHENMPNSIPLLTPSNSAALELMIIQWLEKADFGPKEDTDGSCNKGWRVKTIHEGWDYSIFSVEPAWIVYSK